MACGICHRICETMHSVSEDCLYVREELFCVDLLLFRVKFFEPVEPLDRLLRDLLQKSGWNRRFLLYRTLICDPYR